MHDIPLRGKKSRTSRGKRKVIRRIIHTYKRRKDQRLKDLKIFLLCNPLRPALGVRDVPPCPFLRDA